MKGYVYVLSNPSMPGLVKIGRTTRSVEQRANELWQTGVPTPFIVEYCQLFPDCIKAERELHYRFKDFRTANSREFFSVSKDDVIGEIYSKIYVILAMFVNEYEPTLHLVDAETELLLRKLQQRSVKIGVSMPTLVEALVTKSDDEIMKDVAALDRRNSEECEAL